MSSGSRLSAIAIIVVFASYASAQGPGGIGQSGKVGGTIQVRVLLSSDRPAEEHLRVDLLTGGGSMVTAVFTNSNGMAYFADVAGGDYRVRVSGTNIEEAFSGSFLFDPRERNHTETVVVQPHVSQSPSTAAPPSVAVVDLDVPKPARKSVEKGVEAFNRGKLDEARKEFEKGIELYPAYASAYNFLGLTFLQQKEADRARQAFEKAVELNDHFAEAYTNLAKIYFRQQQFDRCEPLLEKSVASDPRNPEALTYLAQVQLLSGKYQEAAATARRVHELPHKDYAIVHFMAARALRARNQRSDAIAEYKLFLQEAPSNSNSAQAKQELLQLEKRP